MFKFFSCTVFYLFIGSFATAQNIKEYSIFDDFDLKVDIPSKMLFNQMNEGKIFFSNNGKKSWDYVQVNISISENVDIFDLNSNYKTSWILEKIKPYEKKEIVFKIKSNSTEDFTCNVTLIARTKPNHIGIAKSVTQHRILMSLRANYFAKYDTHDPIFISEKTTYVLRIEVDKIKDVKNLFLINKIDSKMNFIGASGPTEYWYDQEKKTVIFFPLLLENAEKTITYEVTCEAIEPGNSLNKMLLWTNFLGRHASFEEPTSIIDTRR